MPVVTRGSRARGRWWDRLGLDGRSEGIPWYINAPMTVFVREGTVVATGGRFIKKKFLLLSTKITINNLRNHHIKKSKKYCELKNTAISSISLFHKILTFENIVISSFSLFHEIKPIDCRRPINRPSAFGRCS